MRSPALHACRRRPISRAAMMLNSLEVPYCQTSLSRAKAPLQEVSDSRRAGGEPAGRRGEAHESAWPRCAARAASQGCAGCAGMRRQACSSRQGTRPMSPQGSVPSCSSAEPCHTMRAGQAPAGKGGRRRMRSGRGEWMWSKQRMHARSASSSSSSPSGCPQSNPAHPAAPAAAGARAASAPGSWLRLCAQSRRRCCRCRRRMEGACIWFCQSVGLPACVLARAPPAAACARCPSGTSHRRYGARKVPALSASPCSGTPSPLKAPAKVCTELRADVKARARGVQGAGGGQALGARQAAANAASSSQRTAGQHKLSTALEAVSLTAAR